MRFKARCQVLQLDYLFILQHCVLHVQECYYLFRVQASMAVSGTNPSLASLRKSPLSSPVLPGIFSSQLFLLCIRTRVPLGMDAWTSSNCAMGKRTARTVQMRIMTLARGSTAPPSARWALFFWQSLFESRHAITKDVLNFLFVQEV